MMQQATLVQQQQQQQQQQAAAAGKIQDWIKSFNAQCHRDVFPQKAQIGELAVGNPVAFSGEVKKQGMPQAKDVALLGSVAAPPSATAVGGGKGGKGGKGSKSEK